MTQERLCVFCKHFQMDAGGSWSEYTHEAPELRCSQHHWSQSLNGTQEEFRNNILKAFDCIDYEVAQ